MALGHQAPKHVLCAALLASSGGQGALHVPVQAGPVVEGLTQVKQLGKGSVRFCQALQALQQGLPILSKRVCTCQASPQLRAQMPCKVTAFVGAANAPETLAAREQLVSSPRQPRQPTTRLPGGGASTWGPQMSRPSAHPRRQQAASMLRLQHTGPRSQLVAADIT